MPDEPQVNDEVRATARLALTLFGMNGGLALAFVGALAGTWDIPAARIGFGESAIYFGSGALCALGAIIGLYVRTWRIIDKLQGSNLTRVYSGAFIMSLIFMLYAMGFASYQLRGCFVADPPVVCQPQDWDFGTVPKGDGKKGGPLSFTGQ